MYLLGLLLMFVAIGRITDGLGAGEPESVRDRIPWLVWVMSAVLVASWALWSWVAGFDAEHWWWTEISVAAASVAIVLIAGLSPPEFLIIFFEALASPAVPALVLGVVFAAGRRRGRGESSASRLTARNGSRPADPPSTQP